MRARGLDCILNHEVKTVSGMFALGSLVVMAKRIRAPKLSSGVSIQQSVRLNPGSDICVPEQDTLLCLVLSTQG